MYATRWQHLRPIDQKPHWMEAGHYQRLRRCAEEVCRRTGVTAWIDVAAIKLVWGPWRGGEAGRWYEVPMYREGGSSTPYRMDPALGEESVDDVVRVIERVKIDVHEKAKLIRKNELHRERSDAHETEEAKNRLKQKMQDELKRRRPGLVMA